MISKSIKKSFLIFAFLLLFLPAVSSATCKCAKDNLSIQIDSGINADDCHQECANIGGNSYSTSDDPDLPYITVTKTAIATAPSSTAQSNAASSSGKYEYKMMEKIPGFENASTDLPSFLLSIYKFGLWTIGIASLLMVTVGGFMYITSAGNSSSMGKARKFITDALAGLVLAFVAYLILYIINPDLVKIQLNNFNLSSDSGGNIANNTTGGGAINTNISKMCEPANHTDPSNPASAIDFTKSTTDSSVKISSTCDQYDNLFSQYATGGVDKCHLKAMAQMESSCGTNKGPSSAGACGLMQLTPATATDMNNGITVTCNQLKVDDALSIRLAVKYISKHMGDAAVTSAKNPTSAIFAGYNSGYGTRSCTGSRRPSLCPSSDCLEAKAFECCKNPGGLGESIKYAWNGYALYQQCKAQTATD